MTPALEWLTARPIAHRGLHDISRGILENTASAFAAAIAHNFAIECDLQITADGEAVVFHDERLERLTGASGWVHETSTSEITRLELRHSKDHVQTLAELLAQVQGKAPLVIELKSHWNGSDALMRRALDVLRGYDGPLSLMSFDPDMMVAAQGLSPGTARGLVLQRDMGDPQSRAAWIERTQAQFLAVYFRNMPFAPVTEFRGAGKPVISWTIRSPQEQSVALQHSDQITFEGYLP